LKPLLSQAWYHIPLILLFSGSEAGGSPVGGQPRQSYTESISETKYKNQKCWEHGLSDRGVIILDNPRLIPSIAKIHKNLNIRITYIS
jgi:hypothetical protein